MIKIDNELLQKYLDNFSELIELDMYLLDKNLLRVAGTGVYRRMLGVILPPEGSNGWVKTNKKPLCVIDPLENEVCQNCPMKLSNNCGKEYFVHQPIIYNDEIIYIITIAANSDKDKTKLKQKKDIIIAFLEMIAEKIVVNIAQKEENKLFKEIFYKSSELVIITDTEGEIIYYTENMKKTLSYKKNVYEIIPKISKSYGENFSDDFFGNFEGVSIKREKINMIGKYYQVFYFVHQTQLGERIGADGLEKSLYFGQIIGNSQLMKELKKMIFRASKYSSNCLILGESGTGKGLIAKTIHELSDRKNEKFVAVNCTAIPENLIESELFGYEAGAFTGANKGGKIGYFEVANKGTLFLDEIGDMPMSLQPKILKAIEDGQIFRVGATVPIKLDIRIIAATHNNLQDKISEGSFRKDLYYRLCVMPIEVPSLSERTEDIIELSNVFLQKYSNKFNKNIKSLSEDVKKSLIMHKWSGNVRELENAIEYAVVMEEGEKLALSSLPHDIVFVNEETIQASAVKLDDLRKINLIRLLDRYGRTVEGKTLVAKEMGISMSTLYRDLKKYDIN